MKKSFQEVIVAILPMTVLILALTIIFAPLPQDDLITFIVGAGIMMVGMALFLFGADYSMLRVGALVGEYMIKKRSLVIMLSLGFAIGIGITIAEPSVQVSASQVRDISDGAITKMILIGVVSVGTGIFLAFALLRTLFRLSYYKMMLIGYFAVFAMSFFTSPEFMPIAFDAGGVTTGPVTVPFILALASGITSMIHQSKGDSDSFGMVGVSSLGPVLAVMILGVIFK